MDLNKLIQETTEKQKKNLADFQAYFNASGKLKKAASTNGSYVDKFLADVVNAFLSGQQSHAPVPENTQLKAMWQVLIDNKEYMDALSAVTLPGVTLPKDGTAEQRLAAIVAYLEKQEAEKS